MNNERAYFFSVVVWLLMQSCGASPTEPNVTNAILEDDGEELLANMNLTLFKERFRRLIPYMTFYVANNYVNGQAALAQNYAKELSGTLPRKIPQQQLQHSLLRLAGIPRRDGGNKYRVGPPNQDAKFIPSVQFEPRNIGGDNDYFSPVKYTAKINYADYSTPTYQPVYQIQKTYPEIITPSGQILHKENRYYNIARPLRPLAREHLLKKPPVLGGPQNNYDQDYAARPAVAFNYPSNEFEGPRYVQQSAVVKQQYETAERKPSLIKPVYRKPSVNLNNLIESFQLSERLPERLNKDNIDNSIKALVKILNILHHSRKEDFPQPQEPPPPLPQLNGYVNYKLKTYTRPKVITETKFQVTPNPLYITDDPERYKTAEYVDDVPIKAQVQPDYNHVKDEKVEYYVPYVQDISNDAKQGFRPTVKSDAPTDHSYEITEDIDDDVLQDGRYTLPISTETSTNKGHVAPNEIAAPETKMPKTSAKYGATRGKPNVDYPAYATIPKTSFSCKNQRYKGFFGDPATECQVSTTFGIITIFR